MPLECAEPSELDASKKVEPKSTNCASSLGQVRLSPVWFHGCGACGLNSMTLEARDDPLGARCEAYPNVHNAMFRIGLTPTALQSRIPGYPIDGIRNHP